VGEAPRQLNARTTKGFLALKGLPLLALIATLLVGSAHPHLFFNANDTAALRTSAQTTHAEVAQHITSVLASHLGDPAPSQSDYDDPRFFGQAVAVWAFAYQMTGDAKYAEKARVSLMTYLTWSDWGFGEIQSLGEPDLNTGHFLLGVACAYDWVYDYLSASERAQVAARLGTEANRMAQGLPNAWYVTQYMQNHNWINTAGLGLAALALQGEDARASGWLSLAEANLQKVSGDLNTITDGTWHEGFGYEVYGIGISLPFWTALARTGADYTNIGILKGFGRMWANVQIPDAGKQTLLVHGDFSGWPDQSAVEILRFSAGKFKDGMAEAAAQRWVASGRTHYVFDLYYEVFEFLNFDPTVKATDFKSMPLDAEFTDLGASTLHSSFDPGDLQVGFKAGTYGGHSNFNRMSKGGLPGELLSWGHDHNDDMSFWIYGKGVWLAPEAAGYDASYNAGNPNPANYTTYHNGMLVDGNGGLGDARLSDDNSGLPWFFNRDAEELTPTTGTADYSLAGGRGAGLYDASVGINRWDRMILLARHRYVLVRDDIEATAAHQFDWLCHFQQGANVDTASGWVQGVDNGGQSLGVRVVSPASWSANTGTQTANLMFLFDPSNQTSYVQVHPTTPAAKTQFLTALVPMATSAWASRPRIDALAAGDEGAGAVVSPGSALEERWIFNRLGAAPKTAGDLVLSGLAGVAVRNAAGAPIRAALFGQGSIADQNGARVLLASQSARSIEADLQGTTLVVTGDGIADFHAYSPLATAVTVNGQAAVASLESGMVSWSGAATTTGGGTGTGGGSADAGTGTADAGTGTADAGTGTADAGTGTAGGGGSGGGAADGGTSTGNPSTVIPVATSSLAPHGGCSSSSNVTFLVALAGLAAALRLSRRRRSLSA
jgi:uncharacterized protein (TIGR03382 family)